MFKIFLPFIQRFTLQLGTHVANPSDSKMQYAVPGQHVAWVIEHDKVEVRENSLSLSYYDWTEYDKQFEAIGGFPHWIQIKYVPEWMRTIPEKRCSPPRPEFWSTFLNFLSRVITRYKPFAIEIWNEPEILPEEVDDFWMNIYGCWPDGALFGQMLNVIYPILKIHHPKTTIMGGALMLDNDYHFEFAKQMIQEGQFDVLSFHSYSGWCSDDYSAPLEKADRLTQIYKDLGKKRPPFWLGETAYRVPELCDGFYDRQAEYFNYIFKNAVRHNIRLISWYTLANNNWEHTDLVSNKYSTIDPRKPVYYEFKSKFR